MLKIAFKLHCLHLDPEFPLQMWNVLDRDYTGSTRTTNALDTYRHSLNALISCQHPTIWRTSKHSTNLRSCSFRPSAARNNRIQNLTDNYTRADADRLLRGIAYNYMGSHNLAEGGTTVSGPSSDVPTPPFGPSWPRWSWRNGWLMRKWLTAWWGDLHHIVVWNGSD